MCVYVCVLHKDTVADGDGVVSLRQPVLEDGSLVLYTAVKLAEGRESRCPHPHDQILVLVPVIILIGVGIQLVHGTRPVQRLVRLVHERCKKQGTQQLNHANVM